MHGRTMLLFACLVLLTQTLHADQAADEKTLKEAGLDPSGPALLKFLKSFVPTADNPDLIEQLVRQLGSEEFEEREAAGPKLIAFGGRAAPFLRKALRDPDRELAKRAEACLRVIDAGPGSWVHAAAIRIVAQARPDAAAEVFLDYVPFVPYESLIEDVRVGLISVGRVEGKTDAALIRALADKLPLRRALAAEVLCQIAPDQRPAVKKLLADEDLSVRTRAGLALVWEAKDRDAVPVLIELLGKVAPAQRGPIEDVLFRLAGNKAPTPATWESWGEWWRKNGANIDLARLGDKATSQGRTILLQQADGLVWEVDAAGKERWRFQGANLPMSIEVVGPDRFLLAEYRGKRVTERNSKGEILWEHAILWATSAQRLANGNTFISTRTALLEIDKKGNTVFNQAVGAKFIFAAQKLPNGEMVCLVSGGECLRLDATGKELQRFRVGAVGKLGASMAISGKGQIFLPQTQRNKVVEFNAEGKQVREIDVPSPDSVTVLPSGNLLVASSIQRRVVEIDQKGAVVWEHRTDGAVTRAVRY